jgi:hypothetical protein
LQAIDVFVVYSAANIGDVGENKKTAEKLDSGVAHGIVGMGSAVSVDGSCAA